MPPFAQIQSGRPAAAVLTVLGGSLLLAASAQVIVPLWPVPMTMQTLAVLLLGAMAGARLGTLAVIAYLAEAALGLPVLAGGKSLLTLGPTAGYLAGFVPSAWLTGWLVQRGWRDGLKLASALMLGSLVVFLPGVAWLRGFVPDWTTALHSGFLLFVPGVVVKAALAWALMRVLPKAAA